MAESGYSVYILRCRDGSLYTGITNDLKRRLEEHKNGKGARYTRAKAPERIVYTEDAGSRSAALKREAFIKSLPRAKKEALFAPAEPKSQLTHKAAMKTFSDRVVEIALLVPRGRVTTYGAIARAAGGGSMAARSITGILGKAQDRGVRDIPYHRIVYGDGRIWVNESQRTKRMALYAAEGIAVDSRDRIVDFRDKLLDFRD